MKYHVVEQGRAGTWADAGSFHDCEARTAARHAHQRRLGHHTTRRGTLHADGRRCCGGCGGCTFLVSMAEAGLARLPSSESATYFASSEAVAIAMGAPHSRSRSSSSVSSVSYSHSHSHSHGHGHGGAGQQPRVHARA
jgi:hypothetical protein